MTMRLIRYVKRGPGAFVGLALLLVLGVLGCTAYADFLRSQITPEQAVRAYVQLIPPGTSSVTEGRAGLATTSRSCALKPRSCWM